MENFLRLVSQTATAIWNLNKIDIVIVSVLPARHNENFMYQMIASWHGIDGNKNCTCLFVGGVEVVYVYGSWLYWFQNFQIDKRVCACSHRKLMWTGLYLNLVIVVYMKVVWVYNVYCIYCESYCNRHQSHLFAVHRYDRYANLEF